MNGIDWVASANALGIGIALGAGLYAFLRWVVGGFFIVNQGRRAVKLRFGRAQRLAEGAPVPTQGLPEGESERYAYPQLVVVPPGGPYFKWPWEKIVKVSVATEITNMAFDPETPHANKNGTVLDAVTKDQLNVGLTGQIRYRVSERNLYAYLFGVRSPIVHVTAYFISILRQRIASFEAPSAAEQDPTAGVSGISINDLRKNLREINEFMERECVGSESRYGVVLEASLITGIDAPTEVESALAAINTAHNHVSSEISLAQAAADQKIVQSRRAVEIETLKAQAEVEPLTALAAQLADLKRSGAGALGAYLRNLRLALPAKARQIFAEVRNG